jgi:hypothetical protein
MRIFKANTALIAIAAILLTLCSANVFAQRNMRAKERIDQVKKVKLLEVLELDEKTADKFLAKYSVWENKIKDKKEANNKLTKELEMAIKKNTDKAEISKLTTRYMESMNDFHKMMIDRNNDIKTILDEMQFAKYLLFEENFFRDIQKVMFKMMKPIDGEMPPHPRKRR